ncbi:MAG: hypothetical protein HRU03_04600 [Nanoarchaeales archaeon]|nr:hypothetical protein [Nanoarchaeales archaeon]
MSKLNELNSKDKTYLNDIQAQIISFCNRLVINLKLGGAKIQEIETVLRNPNSQNNEERGIRLGFLFKNKDSLFNIEFDFEFESSKQNLKLTKIETAYFKEDMKPKHSKQINSELCEMYSDISKTQSMNSVPFEIE